MWIEVASCVVNTDDYGCFWIRKNKDDDEFEILAQSNNFKNNMIMTSYKPSQVSSAQKK